MNKLRKIIYTSVLEQKKERLEQECQLVQEEIRKNCCSCNEEHIYVKTPDTIKWKHLHYHQGVDRTWCCLWCGDREPNSRQFSVDVTNWISVRESSDEKVLEKLSLNNIRLLAFEIIKENPNISNQELVESLDTWLANDLEKRKESYQKLNK